MLRDELRKKRNKLSGEQAKVLSDKIIQNLLNYVNFSDISTLHIYRNIPELKEVETKKIIDYIRKNYPKVYITLPTQKAKLTEIPENEYFDLVIVPTLGFDRSGNRIGWGIGYYDKFLSQNNCRSKIGLAYSFSELEKIPIEDHDQKLDAIITEEEIIKPS